jgi:hypothetical protein
LAFAPPSITMAGTASGVVMSSSLGGNDPAHDFSSDQKDKKEKTLRQEGKALRKKGKPKEGQKKNDRANEISREKSKRAHQ